MYTEVQGLINEYLGYVIYHDNRDWKHPVPPPRIKRVSFIKGVLEAKEPQDSSWVEAMRQKLLEYFACTVFQDQTGVNLPIQCQYVETIIIFKPGAVPVKQ